MKDIKKDILWRIYLIYLCVLIFAFVIIGKVVKIQFVEGEQWLNKSKNSTLRYSDIKANRGNIYSDDGNLLATSLPFFDVRIDLISNIKEKVFNKQIDSLSYCLSMLFKDKTKSQYKNILINARKQGNKYFLVKRKITYDELKKMRSFPILKFGRYRGGMIVIKKDKRKKPFEMLASRTIGYDRPGYHVGLEGAYRKILKGVNGKRLERKISGGVWIPVNDENQIESKNGKDIFTTININIQDIAENALLLQLKKYDADHGTVVLMEVKTGYIKAIANIGKNNKGEYHELYNYAIGEKTDPGSTFKLASLMAAIEDGYVNLTDSVETGNGIYYFYDHKMEDDKYGGYGKITVKKAFEVSSNIGISKIITKYYYGKEQKFVDALCRMGINKKTGTEINGEELPLIKPISKWSGVTLPQMSIGYEIRLTPLQILTFYNAVANDGEMVKPRFVESVQYHGKTIKSYYTQVINPSICSKKTIEKVKKMLEGVVQKGTAKNIKNDNFKIAGKTGTVQILNKKYGYKYKHNKIYQASFVGYFPADNPEYSCIVVINNPTQNGYYGSIVAAPVFKKIAEKVYATLCTHKQPVNNTDKISTSITKVGNNNDFNVIYKTLGLSPDIPDINSEWIIEKNDPFNKTKFYKKNIDYNLVPDLRGMKLKDAVYILENQGLFVEINGKGTVRRQSIKYGTKIIKNEKIVLYLS
jgi:cell division protein FtsI (penicillin-binding protein 3)